MRLRWAAGLLVTLALVTGCAPVYDRGVILEKEWYYLKPNIKHCFYLEDPETKRKGECLEVSEKVYDSYDEGDFYPRENG